MKEREEKRKRREWVSLSGEKEQFSEISLGLRPLQPGHQDKDRQKGWWLLSGDLWHSTRDGTSLTCSLQIPALGDSQAWNRGTERAQPHKQITAWVTQTGASHSAQLNSLTPIAAQMEEMNGVSMGFTSHSPPTRAEKVRWAMLLAGQFWRSNYPITSVLNILIFHSGYMVAFSL